MPDQQELEQAVRDLIQDLIMVLSRHGVAQVSMGSLMRLCGVDNETATRYDDEIVDLLHTDSGAAEVPAGVTLH